MEALYLMEMFLFSQINLYSGNSIFNNLCWCYFVIRLIFELLAGSIPYFLQKDFIIIIIFVFEIMLLLLLLYEFTSQRANKFLATSYQFLRAFILDFRLL